MRRGGRKLKRAYDYETGELLRDGDSSWPGRIMSMRRHPDRPMVYFLCRNDRDEWTMMVSLADAVCEPWLARQVPASVMEEMLYDAFVGYVLPTPVTPERFARRSSARPQVKPQAVAVSESLWLPAVDLP